MEHAIEQAAKVIDDVLSADPQVAHEMFGDEPDKIARALADAGLIAPAPLREVATAEELDALPESSVVINRGMAWQKVPHRERMVVGGWVCADPIYPGIYNDPVSQRGAILPATVLYVPVDRAEGDGRAGQ